MSKDEEVYLGDGVYAHFDGQSLWLRASREDGGDELIALDPVVFEALREFARKVGIET
jgi:hypothetical protein